jgi:16S rRNA (cytidine1402-2'-O)-methyltransferase
MNTARLYIVATPIGNLEDITLRALKVLGSVEVVAAEDTRHSRALLAHHGIENRLTSLHEHNEEKQSSQLLERLEQGESVALISDAGTPLVSDPGYRLVTLAAQAGVEIVTVPGASAVTAALSVSGLPTDRFAFEGFLPAKGAARRKRLNSLAGEERTLVFYESSHRIEDCLADMTAILGEVRPAAVCRELTKRFETVLRGSLFELRDRVASDPDQRRGEFVVVVGGASTDGNEDLARAVQLAEALADHVGASQAARIAASIHGATRRDVYRRLLEPG